MEISDIYKSMSWLSQTDHVQSSEKKITVKAPPQAWVSCVVKFSVLMSLYVIGQMDDSVKKSRNI